MRTSLWKRIVSASLAFAMVIMFAPPPLVANADGLTYVAANSGVGSDTFNGAFVANDNTPYALHLASGIGGLASSQLYAYSICATTTTVAAAPAPVPGADLGYVWNGVNGQWVQANDWSQCPTLTTDGTGQIGGGASSWAYGKVADDNLPAGIALTLVVAFRKANADGSFPDSTVYYSTGSNDQPVTVQSIAGTGLTALAWAHASTYCGKPGPTRIAAILPPFAGTNPAFSLMRNSSVAGTTTPCPPDDTGVVGDLYGGTGTGDFRLPVPASTQVLFVSGNSNNGVLGVPFKTGSVPTTYTTGPADTEVAAGVTTDTTPPSAPGSLTDTYTAGSVSLTWGPSTDNTAVVGYYVYRWQDPVTSTWTPYPGLTTAAPVRIATVTAGTSYTDSSVPVGTYHYRVRAYDAATNVGPRSNTVAATSSIILPSTTASPTVGSGFNDAVAFSLTATDQGGPGIANTFFSADRGAVTTYSAGIGLVPIFTTDGTHTLSYYSKDSSGNTETSHDSTFTIVDTLAPHTTAPDLAPTYSDMATITLSATDSQLLGLGFGVTAIGSGVAGTHWSLDGGSTWTTGTQVVESQASTSPYTLRFYSTDNVGHNEATQSVTFTVNDTIPPVTSSDATSSYVGTATIHFTAHDNTGGLGVGATYYSLDGGGFVQGTSVTTTATGSHSLLFYSTDKASPTPNSESVKSVNFAVTAFDTTPPTSSSDATASYIVTATVHISATDNPGGIGIGAVYYKLDGGSAVTTVVAVGSPTTLTAPVVVTGAGSHSIEFWSADLLGNVESPHHTVNFTIGKPSSTISISAVPASVKLPKPFVLSGSLSIPTNGLSCVVYVKKPGSARWSYSSNRLTYNAAGAASSWWYRYTPKLRGTYSFYVNFAGDGTHIAATSRTIKVTVK